MKPLKLPRLTKGAFVLLVAGLTIVATPLATLGQDSKPLVVFLVRHAEKLSGGSDPKLSGDGEKRALELAAMLRSAKIEFIHSTDYSRTRDTAGPIAHDQKIEVRHYNPRGLQAFAEQLREKGGRHLIVGHSNTTPALVKLLGGKPGPPIDEKQEYDRLYVLSVNPDGETTSILIRYGAPFTQGHSP